MAPFPSSEEQAVASSLLLLHTTPSSPSISSPKFNFNSNDEVLERSSSKSFRESLVYSGSNNSSSSSLINDDGDSSDKSKIKSRSVSFFSATARYRHMKFKIARKIRSKVMWTSSSSSSGDRKQNANASFKVTQVAVSGESTSCLSNSSSGISSERSLRYANRVSRCASTRETRMGRELPAPAKPHRAKNVVGSPHLRRRGEAILKFLSLGGSSEMRIRQMLGDSPDTSKALRMLLRVDAVKRTGTGGRHDPYVYTITQITGRN